MSTPAAHGDALHVIAFQPRDTIDFRRAAYGRVFKKIAAPRGEAIDRSLWLKLSNKNGLNSSQRCLSRWACQ